MSSVPGHPPRNRDADLPALGIRGGGWVTIQVVLIAGVFLSAVVGLGWPRSLAPVFYAVGAVLVAAGAALLVAGAIGLGSALTPFPAPRSTGELQTGGVYRLARHPMYGGGILIALGWSAIFATVVGLALTLLLAVFADLKSRREELWLERHYADYGAYRLRTRHRLIPFVW
ncbi:MAG TPA: isoprenylcysteine carboxylmethyltransferase family protein [Gaiellaceae bacterium]|nr:isoprenylcysteine carboxylmethyltransferase family protein [Gaiellaceae bacterium]